ncbi:MAG: hypothetical protein OEZ51_05455 [Nitrospinota bacterium]|nr:hypothetical protein [Nitrospinota bacterium]
MRQPGLRAYWVLITILWMGTPDEGLAEPVMGIGELDSLISQHLPQKDPRLTGKTLKNFVVNQSVGGSETTAFLIPGFENYDCGKCHQPEQLIQKAAGRMKRAIDALQKALPEIKQVPLRQYIIQPYSDALLQPGQLAHATFDTIRISPGSILIDTKAYGEATHLHETLHLTQAFLGHVNELEAYGLNIRSNPQFLILNYPYFAKVLEAFFIPDMDQILQTYFERGIREQSSVPREVQWFLDEYDGKTMARLSQAIKKMEPLLKEVSRLNREQPLQAAYWSDRTGVSSLLLEISAVKHLPLPELKVSDETKAWAFDVFNLQFDKDDNTRLGYVIDRRKEALMHLEYSKGPKDPAQRLALYFHYLKQRFLDDEGEIRLDVKNQNALTDYVNQKMGGIKSMMDRPGFTPVEQQAARNWISSIKKELSALEKAENP